MDYYGVNKDCARIWNNASAGEAVSSTISKAATTPFSVTDCLCRSIRTSAVEAVSLIIFYSSTTLLSVTITESTGAVRVYETELQLGKRFPR